MYSFWTYLQEVLQISPKSVPWDPSYYMRINKLGDVVNIKVVFPYLCECACAETRLGEAA